MMGAVDYFETRTDAIGGFLSLRSKISYLRFLFLSPNLFLQGFSDFLFVFNTSVSESN